MWRKNFDVLARDFRVYAVDLPGFGFSDKPNTATYSADLYVELITDFIREVADILRISLPVPWSLQRLCETPKVPTVICR